MRTTESGDIGVLLTNTESAVAVLEQIAARLDGHDEARAAIDGALARLSGFVPALQDLQGTGVSHPKSWVLDRSWHPVAFGVASHSPRVLLTIGSNALRTLDDLYSSMLDEELPGVVDATLQDQVKTIRCQQNRLIDLRTSISESD